MHASQAPHASHFTITVGLVPMATLRSSETTDSRLFHVSIALSDTASCPPNTHPGHPLGEHAVGIHDSALLTPLQSHQRINTRREVARVFCQLLRVHVAQVESNGLSTRTPDSPLRHRTRFYADIIGAPHLCSFLACELLISDLS